MDKSMEIREYGEEEQERSFYLGSQAFQGGNREDHWAGNPNRPDALRFGIFDSQGRIQMRAAILPFQVHLGPEVVVPMGGVAGVACLPDQRGKGYAGECLRYALQRMRDAGQTLSSLMPFSWEFYRNLGFDWVGEDRTYTVKSASLPKPDPETERVREAQPDERERIVAFYTQFAGRYRGMIQRDPKHWNRVLDHAKDKFTYTYLYEQAGEIEGYLTFAGWKEEQTEIREFLTTTPRALRALLGLLRRMDMQVEKFRWNAPADDLLWTQTYSWELETSVRPLCMARVVDVAGALSLWKPNPEVRGSVALAVQDVHAPWNTGTWRVEAEAGQITVQRTETEPQVALDIQALSQAYWGTPGLDTLRRAGRLTVSDEAGFQALRAVLEGPPMWMNDEF